MIELFILLVVLNLLDMYTTWKIVGKQGGREVNPIVAKLIEILGIVPALLLVKTLFLGFVYLYAMDSIALLAAMCGFYGWVVWHNFKEIK